MSVEERNRVAAEMRGLSAVALAERLFGLLRNGGDGGQIDLAWRLLVPKLQTELASADKRSVYGAIDLFLADPGLGYRAKFQLIEMLGRTATPEALSLLLQTAQDGTLPELQQLVLKMIRGTGQVQWGGRFHEELSPLLEEAWDSAGRTPGLREAVAEALAGVGAASGLERLYTEALRGGPTLSTFAAQEDNLAWEVLDVFRRVRNPAAVPTLASRLGDQPLDNLELVLSGTALAAMGRPEATAALLGWAEGSNRHVGALLQPWFAEVRDPDSFALLERAVSEPTRFGRDENWAAVERALREWHARRETSTSEE